MATSETIPFYKRKWFKLLKLFVATIVMCGLCVLLLLRNESDMQRKVVAWFGLAFFGGGGMAAIGRMLWLKHKGLPLVTITDEGLVIMGKAIRWENIESLAGSRYGLLVMTNNIEERMAKANPLKRLLNKFDKKYFGTDIIINEDWLDGTFQQFVDRCKPYIEQHHPAGSCEFYK